MNLSLMEVSLYEKKRFPLTFRNTIDFGFYLITRHFTKVSKLFS